MSDTTGGGTGEPRAPFDPRASVADGLATYDVGSGSPAFVFPYPHSADLGPAGDSDLVRAVTGIRRRVITFDPPGHGMSTRPPDVGLDEMIRCAIETLDRSHIDRPVPVVGHSMSALCAFEFTRHHPDRVSRLVLVGTPPGSGWSIVRWRAMPFHWAPWRPEMWKSIWWGVMLASGRGNLEMHKRMNHLRAVASYHDPSLVGPLEIDVDDRDTPAPPLDAWWYRIRRLRTIPHAAEIRRPTLLVVGRHDHQTPLPVSEALRGRIAGAQLVIFERSGHSPFIEEPERFAAVLTGFLDADPSVG